MLCNGGLAQPVLITPIDVIHLLPGMGDYTCCARNHGEQGHVKKLASLEPF
jgi:hypothetical protein